MNPTKWQADFFVHLGRCTFCETLTKDGAGNVRLCSTCFDMLTNGRVKLADARRAALEEAAALAKMSHFADGPKGTIESQIAEAILAIAEKKAGA